MASKDVGGERGLCVWRGWGVRPLDGAINIDQWEQGVAAKEVGGRPEAA